MQLIADEMRVAMALTGTTGVDPIDARILVKPPER